LTRRCGSYLTRHFHALNEKYLRVIWFNCAQKRSNCAGNQDNAPEQAHRSTPLREVLTGESLAGVRAASNRRDNSLQAQASARTGPCGEEMSGPDASAGGKRKLTSQPKAASSKQPREKVHSERHREAPVPAPRPALEQNRAQSNQGSETEGEETQPGPSTS
jgi:hypothetical protein